MNGGFVKISASKRTFQGGLRCLGMLFVIDWLISRWVSQSEAFIQNTFLFSQLQQYDKVVSYLNTHTNAQICKCWFKKKKKRIHKASINVAKMADEE